MARRWRRCAVSQRGEDDGEARLGAAELAAARTRDEEVLRRRSLGRRTAIADRRRGADVPCAGRSWDAAKLASSTADRSTGVRGRAGRARRRRTPSIARPSARADRADHLAGDQQQRLASGRSIATWVGATRRSSAPSIRSWPGTDRAIRASSPSAAKVPSVSEISRSCALSGGEARVVGGLAPVLHAAEPGVDPGADRDHERDRDDQDPAAAQVAGRPAKPEAQARPSATSAGRRSSAGPPGAGASETTRPLESSITRWATRAISRLWVTTSTAVSCSWVCAVQQLEDLHAGTEVELAGRLVGEQDRVPGRERAGDRDALLLAAGELVREVVGRGSRARPGRASRVATPRGVAAAGDVGAELDVLERGQRREQVEGLEDEADRVAAKLEQLASRCAG